jgi:hypothetical protein
MGILSFDLPLMWTSNFDMELIYLDTTNCGPTVGVESMLLTCVPLVRWAGSLLPGGEEVSWSVLARGVGLANLLEGLDPHFQVFSSKNPQVITKM